MIKTESDDEFEDVRNNYEFEDSDDEVFEDAHAAKEKERLNFVFTLSYTVELCLFGDLN